MKNVSKNKLQSFLQGLKNGNRLSVMIASFLLMLILWVPMMYGSMTLSLFTGQDGMSNKELNGLQHRLDDRYQNVWGVIKMTLAKGIILILLQLFCVF